MSVGNRVYLTPEDACLLGIDAEGDGPVPITPDPDQAWFWSPEWLPGELEASRHVAAGNTDIHECGDAFLIVTEERNRLPRWRRLYA